MSDNDDLKSLRRLSELQNQFLMSLKPNRGLNSIHVAPGSLGLGQWLLLRWDREVTGRKDFVYISDAHYKRSGFYIDYDSLLGVDYDDLVDALLGKKP
ncbi:hypothetical protein [Marinobacter sp.]|uniref:hypothetical protein n=1 Tax=Marinobacter sp. TaxID=50741 RepID=UPI003BA887C4